MMASFCARGGCGIVVHPRPSSSWVGLGVRPDRTRGSGTEQFRGMKGTARSLRRRRPDAAAGTDSAEAKPAGEDDSRKRQQKSELSRDVAPIQDDDERVECLRKS